MNLLDRSSRRLGSMSIDDRQELWKIAMETVFPKGYWKCGCLENGVLACVAKGKPCPICKSQQSLIGRFCDWLRGLDLMP